MLIFYRNKEQVQEEGNNGNENKGTRIDPDVLNSFKAKIDSDINTLRNLTYKALHQSSKSQIRFKM